MRVSLLRKCPETYSCNVYHVRGDWNSLDDVNTLIDVGTNDYILGEIDEMSSTGVGKRKVEQIIITHAHFDHAGGLGRVKGALNPIVIAHDKIPGVDRRARDGMRVRVGDREGRIIHAPGHSNDSIMIYIEAEGVLFSGDAPLSIRTPGGTYQREYVEVLKRLARLDIRTVYSGHDPPCTERASEMIRATLENVLLSA